MWMLPRSNAYGGWPRSGEIDIMESRGGAGEYGVFSTLHWGPGFNNNRFSMTTGAKKMNDWSSDFHVWRLEWTADSITTFVDNQQIFTVNPGSSFWDYGNFQGGNIWSSGGKMAPFDQDFYAILTWRWAAPTATSRTTSTPTRRPASPGSTAPLTRPRTFGTSAATGRARGTSQAPTTPSWSTTSSSAIFNLAL